MTSPSPSSLYFTRDVFKTVLPHIHGDTIDLGAGLSRYKWMITPRATTYKTMDIQAFPGIDVVGDVLAPPFPDASFDTALSMHVLEHVREPWTAITQMARILRPGGMAIVSVPFVYPHHADPHDYFRFSEDGIRSLFERAGMEIVLCSKFGGWWAVQGETFKQRFVSPYRGPHPRWKRRLKDVVEWICAAFNHLCLPGIVYANVICVARKPS
jgi:SAM-dependent methyltransferase